MDQLKRTNKTTNKYYAQSFNIDDQLSQYRNHITIDERTSVSITSDILMNIDKAQKAISPELFSKFIHHIQQQQTGKLVDLSKYINMTNMISRNTINHPHVNSVNRSRNMNMNANNNYIKQRPLRSRHTRQSIATQTNQQRQQQLQQQRNGHAMSQSPVQPQQLQQQQNSPTNQQQRSKPPLISSQPQRSPNGGRQPRSQFQQQRQTRRPPARNINNRNSNSMYSSYQQ